ncbi:MAG: YCF48-related protein [Candidatus Sulfotelmatobacter sp.]
MQNVPKFVLKGLQEPVPGAESHPDADLLTAFAEQSLAGRERALVMEHLAICGECRDVVTLALPASEITSPTDSPRSAGIGWFAWPVLRWGALAAGILAVASVGVLQYTDRHQEKIVASNLVRNNLMQNNSRQKEEPLSSPLAQRALPPVAPTIETADKKTSAHELVSKARPFFSGASQGRSARIGGGSGGGMAVGASPVSTGANASRDTASPQALEATLQAPNAAPEIRQQVRVGTSSTVVEVQSAAVPANSVVGGPQNQLAQNQADLPVVDLSVADLSVKDMPVKDRNVTNLDVVKAKDPVAPQPASASPSQPVQISSSVMVRVPSRWAVTPSGALQRSFDGGNTWENVVPTLFPARAADRNGALQSGVQRAAENVAQDSKDQEVVPAPSPKLTFRAVAASGLEVWAGTSDGALYHTSDGGNRWARVIPSEAGTFLSGEIASIEFSDPQHGKVATSTAELWTTSDAGQRWHKQP